MLGGKSPKPAQVVVKDAHVIGQRFAWRPMASQVAKVRKVEKLALVLLPVAIAEHLQTTTTTTTTTTTIKVAMIDSNHSGLVSSSWLPSSLKFWNEIHYLSMFNKDSMIQNLIIKNLMQYNFCNPSSTLKATKIGILDRYLVTSFYLIGLFISWFSLHLLSCIL